MTNCTGKQLTFPACRHRKVEAEFSGGEVTSGGGVLLIRDIDRRLNLTRQVAAVLPDPRDPKKCDHTILDLVRQRVFGLVLGFAKIKF